MKLEFTEEQPNYHVARINLAGLDSLGTAVQAFARVFLVTNGYAIETGIGASVQPDGGDLTFDAAKDLATRMLERQLQSLQERIQGVLKGGEEEGFGEVRPDGG